MHTETLIYCADSHTMHSHLCLPERAENAPAVLVFPEWWGLSEHAKNSAESLAQHGYIALAVDLYGNAMLTDQAEIAAQHMNETLTGNTLRTRVQAALNALSTAAPIDSQRIAAIGYCFGGGIALNMARWTMPIKAAVSFHGNPDPFESRAESGVHTAMLLQHGSEDSLINMAQIDAFRAEMDAINADYHIDFFPAKHGFTNPQATANGIKNGVDLAYHETAARQSWENMLRFLQRVFQA